MITAGLLAVATNIGDSLSEWNFVVGGGRVWGGFEWKTFNIAIAMDMIYTVH